MRIIYTIGFFCLSTLKGLSQDPQFSQPYAAPLYLNPAYAGYAEGFRANTGYRNQWRDLGRYNTFTASADIPYECGNIKMGGGLYLMSDHQNADVTTLTGGFVIVPPVLDFGTFSIRAGVYLGGGQRSYQQDRFTFMDQLSTNGILPATQDPMATVSGSKSFLDVGGGALFDFSYFGNNQAWVGFSAYHFNEPDVSIGKEHYRLPMRLNAHMGTKLISNSETWSLSPVANLRRQSKLVQLDFGAYVNYYPFVAGLFYRGIPLSRSLVRLPTQDALIVLVGIEHDDFSFGFSYDITVSKLKGYTGNTFEFTLRYSNFDWWWGCDENGRKNRQNKRSQMESVRCPK